MSTDKHSEFEAPYVYCFEDGDCVECGMAVQGIHATLESALKQAEAVLVNTDSYKWEEIEFGGYEKYWRKRYTNGNESYDIAGIIKQKIEGWQAHAGSPDADVVKLRSRLTKLSFLITGNDYAFFTENPEIDEAVKVYNENVIEDFKEKAESLSGAAPSKEIECIEFIIKKITARFCNLCGANEGQSHASYCEIHLLESVRASLQKKGR